MPLLENVYNPDILNCLANLSNDEVFTPPEMVNRMLDLLPQELFRDSHATFLDPACKTGVFLREIAKRLLEGLKDEIPDEEERRNHIFTKQLYGIAITEMTAMLSRRSLYCSKFANGRYSIVPFDKPEGNIRFKNLSHYWEGTRCGFCGASKSEYDRAKDLEQHAYEFIHTVKPEDIWKMKFDVIIGNPPYQLSDGGHGVSAKPIYNQFVEQAKKLNPRYLSMIIPARWYAGGKGLDDFRASMLSDRRLVNLVDYFDSTECFPGVDLSGGICYFLWDRDNPRDCEIRTIRNRKESILTRPMLESGVEIFIRFNEAIEIVRKVQSKKENSFSSEISARKPFGLSTKVDVASHKTKENNTFIYSNPTDGYISSDLITNNQEAIDKSKVFISYAYGERGNFPYLVIGKPFIGRKNSCCSETYLMVGPFQNEETSYNVISYMKTKFFRFLVLLKKNTQHATKSVYQLVPTQDFSKPWKDSELYTKYGLSDEEISFIESLIRPMDLEGIGNV